LFDIVQGLREAYERHHRCVYEPAALDAAVALSACYIADRQLPDKVRLHLMHAAAAALLCVHHSKRYKQHVYVHPCRRRGASSHHTTVANLPLRATTDIEEFWAQAIDLLDEAGSRVRIAAYLGRAAADGSGRPGGAGPWAELQDVLAAKAEAAQVGGPPAAPVLHPFCSLGSLVSV
jgi:AAA lid domain